MADLPTQCPRSFDEVLPEAAATNRTIARASAAVAVAMALAIPLYYFVSAKAQLKRDVEGDARLFAGSMALLAEEKLDFWELLRSDTGRDAVATRYAVAEQRESEFERRIFFAESSQLLVELEGPDLGPPYLTASRPFSRGRGVVEVSASLQPILARTAFVGLFSLCLGAALYSGSRLLSRRVTGDVLDRIRFHADHDSTTGLGNRRVLMNRIRAGADAASPHRDHESALLLIDIDRFREFNQAYGPLEGDRFLAAVAKRLSAATAPADVVVRLGSDEFAVFVARTSDRPNLEVLAGRLRGAVQASARDEPVVWGEADASVGIALSGPGMPPDGPDLVRRAGIALTQAKSAGGGGYVLYDPAAEASMIRRRLFERDVRDAVFSDAFEVHFQPQVDLASHRVIGAEALARWNRPGAGTVPPGQFIPVAESIGLISHIGRAVLFRACRAAADWPEPIGVSVNVSPLHFREDRFVDDVLETLRRTGLSPARLELEITEGVLLQDTGETGRTLQKLRDAGIRVAMDDFGSAYAGLGYLSRFKFDRIKLDRDFTSQLERRTRAVAVVRAAVELGRSLDAEVIAEGIENAEQVDVLRDLGCRQGQGFFFGRPVPADAFRLAFEPQSLDLAGE